MTNKTMIHIGTQAEKTARSLPAMTKAIVRILNSAAGDTVKQTAIIEITRLYSSGNGNTFSNCTFEGK